MKFTEINTNTPEGKYLLAAVSLLTGGNKTPESVMAELQPIAVKVYGDDPHAREPKISDLFLREVLRIFGPACEMTPGSGDYWPEQNGGELLIDIRDYLDCKPQQPRDFEKELRRLINGLTLEAESDTPDFILAAYISGSLENFNRAVRNRSNWYGNAYETPSLKNYYREEKRSADIMNDARTGGPFVGGHLSDALEYHLSQQFPEKAVKENQAKIKELTRILEINNSGYGGIDQAGRIVDRREKPDAIPIPKNKLLNVPEPKPWPEPDKPDAFDFIKEDQI